ncbi:MAG: 4Fe-4S dicluster domain-containing protein [bacterium]
MREQKYLGNPFIFADPQKCQHCHNCELACAAEGAKTDLKSAVVRKIPLMARNYLVSVDEITMPVQCRHCEDAPCARVCPLGAIQSAEGRIELHKAMCIGCKTCMMVCPFGAIELVHRLASSQIKEKVSPDALVVDKCDLCIDRLIIGKQPACIQACPTRSLVMVIPERWRQAHRKQSVQDLARALNIQR